VIDYAAPVWAPVINDSTWKYLQTAQNEALRIATGCHKMSHTDHVHVETKLNTTQNFSPNNTGFPATNHTIHVITSPLCLPQLET